MRGFGFIDLVLVSAVVFAVGTRTPVGGLGQWGYAWATGDPERVDLAQFFRSEAAEPAWTDREIPDLDLEPDGFPQPWRAAVRYALPARLPPHTELLLPEGPDLTTRVLTWLDKQDATQPELALERLAIPDTLRNRAIERARASGERRPERFHGYRRYLPQRVEREADAVLGEVLSMATAFDLKWPVDPATRISSPFGHRIHPKLKTRKFHNGIDLPVPVGTPLWAAQEGRVVASTHNAVSGNYVILEHAGGVRTAYCHLSELAPLSSGDPVERGQQIGLSGNTGRSTGPHLHFVLRIAGKPIDPLPFRRN